MRNSIKHVLLAAYTNSVTWIRSPRVWFVLLIQCIMCYGGLYELGNSDGRLHPLNAFSLLPLGKGC